MSNQPFLAPAFSPAEQAEAHNMVFANKMALRHGPAGSPEYKAEYDRVLGGKKPSTPSRVLDKRAIEAANRVSSHPGNKRWVHEYDKVRQSGQQLTQRPFDGLAAALASIR